MNSTIKNLENAAALGIYEAKANLEAEAKNLRTRQYELSIRRQTREKGENGMSFSEIEDRLTEIYKLQI